MVPGRFRLRFGSGGGGECKFNFGSVGRIRLSFGFISSTVCMAVLILVMPSCPLFIGLGRGGGEWCCLPGSVEEEPIPQL